jgi:hypothetical protein
MAKQIVKNTKAPLEAKKVNVQSATKKPLFNFKSQNSELLYDKVNYAIMGVALLLIIIGFACMAGGASSDPNVFNANEVYSFRRITLAPFLVILGFTVGIFAVLKKPSGK